MRTVFLLVCGATAACTASASAVEPPDDQIFYPTGMAIAPDESVLFVANANSDLRYDSGSVSVLDLGMVDQVISDWTGPNQIIPTDGVPCTQDTSYSETLQCDEARFFVPSSGARVGNFATDIAVQDLGAGSLRLIVPTRGDPSISWVDWNGSSLSCNTSTAGFALCDDTHRLSYVENDTNLRALPEEPFYAFADSVGQFAVVTHLATGDITLIDSPAGGDAVISDIASNLFIPDPLTGLEGSTGVSGRLPGANDIVYVGSRTENRIQMLTVGRPANDSPPYWVPGNYFFLMLGAGAGNSTDTRGITFSPSGDRMYLLNRNPPSLQIFDTSLGPTGFPDNTLLAATDICTTASTLTLADSGDGDKVYVTCFNDGQIYVIDPRGLSSLDAIVTVGRGPYAIAAATNRKRVYVTNFLEDTIAVVDIDPASPLRNHVVLRIGVPRPPNQQ
ncbi:MAG TPA: YncE family protein [Kofleriaceae bacterium]|nr:YncE family protein [Kofleriaceae bacterium]